jgi:hypothetical protein
MFKEDGNVIHFANPKGTTPLHRLLDDMKPRKC